jgi:hypothetical protein
MGKVHCFVDYHFVYQNVKISFLREKTHDCSIYTIRKTKVLMFDSKTVVDKEKGKRNTGQGENEWYVFN